MTGDRLLTPEEKAKLAAYLAAVRRGERPRPPIIVPPTVPPKGSMTLEKISATARKQESDHLQRRRNLIRYHYYVYLKRPLRRAWRFLKRLYGIYYAWRHRPPTAAETANAQNYMRQAYSVIDQDYWDKDKYRSPSKSKYIEFNNQLRLLSQGAKSMKRARRLDQNATITVERGDKQYRYTFDALTAELLFMEALTHFYVAQNYYDDASATALQDAPESVFSGAADLKYWLDSRSRETQRLANKAREPLKRAIKARREMPCLCPALYTNPSNSRAVLCSPRLDETSSTRCYQTRYRNRPQRP